MNRVDTRPPNNALRNSTMIRKQVALTWAADTYEMQKETNAVGNARAREHTAPRPGPVDDVRPKAYCTLKGQPDSIRAQAAEAKAALGSILVDVLHMYDTEHPV